MSVYVGMDIHRKRFQVAIVDHAGAVQRNHNLPNGPTELTAILGALPPGTLVAFEAAYGWGGWSSELRWAGISLHRTSSRQGQPGTGRDEK